MAQLAGKACLHLKSLRLLTSIMRLNVIFKSDFVLNIHKSHFNEKNDVCFFSFFSQCFVLSAILRQARDAKKAG